MAPRDFSSTTAAIFGIRLYEVEGYETYSVVRSEKNLAIMDESKCREHLSNEELDSTPIWDEVAKGSVLCTRGPPTLSQSDAGGALLAGDIVIGVNRFRDLRNWKDGSVNYHVNIAFYMDFIKSKVGCGALRWGKISEID
ncbi:hypothetical protein QAD02_010890 [Eretmocerus hayati]|uniref:Uncharacterized protein n=1 Tax=Eretmocerus hayati TaxID=131215 RepID=A0ACC2NVI3_9HYME|nr:hypothetical protein QAD02_010890 [Eretmocerus hayati]